jgi:DNA-binding NarL/FixJ family response regulator
VTRVVVVDDHPIVRSGMAALLASDPAFDVVATAGTVAEALQLTEPSHDAPTPDLAVIDLRLPDGDGVDLAVALRRRWPDLKVLVLTMHAEDDSVMRALAAGLHGYVLKDADPEAILAAVHQVTAGALVIGRGADAGVRAAANNEPPTSSGALATLNTREREILELLASGLATAQVASRLYLAPKTIRNRLSEILDKLGVSTREEAIQLARTAGLGRSRQ